MQSVAGPILMIWSFIPLMGMEIPLAYGSWDLQILPPWSLGPTFRPSASTPALVTTPGGFSDQFPNSEDFPTGHWPVGFPHSHVVVYNRPGALGFSNPSVAGPILMIGSFIPLMGMEIPQAYSPWDLQILPSWSTPGGFSDPTILIFGIRK